MQTRQALETGTRADQGQQPFWTDPLAALLSTLGTDGTGLSTAQAAERLSRFGANRLTRASPLLAFVAILRRVTNPLVIILLAASLVSAFVGEVVNALIISLMVVFSLAIDIYQTRHSQQAAERLRKRVESLATARRDGDWREVAFAEVVPGDLIRLRAGDLVPADARLTQSNRLSVDESTFTGESLPVEKGPADSVQSPGPQGASNAVFMGTVVVSGAGEGVVARTGAATALARITGVLEKAPPETVFDRGLKSFGLLIARTVAVLVVFVLAVNLIEARPFLDSLLFAVALAVGLTPEFLPMILSVTQARGALRMARSRVIVRQLAAIQNLGNMDVICSDKTGTLTTGKMSLAAAIDPDEQKSERVQLLAYLNATLQTDIKSPLDEAIAQSQVSGADAYRLVAEVPFDFERRRLSVAVEARGEVLLVTKGAPESVLAACSSVLRGGKPLTLDQSERSRLDGLIERMGGQGFRLLGVASSNLGTKAPPTLADESGLAFEGLVAFSDPPKEGIGEVVERLRSDAVDLVVLTGDAEAVTRHVCEEIGIAVDRVISGDLVEGLDDAALSAELERSKVFARVSPEQKLRIIQLLQRKGHVVGYMGDGINDAPSLRAADVGISVAEAVDIAREAAEVVLLEKSLGVLHEGIVEGRRVFTNVMKYIMMGTSSNFGNMISMAGAVLFLPFLPLLPSQVLINNALYDLAQVSIPTDNVDEVMTRKPRGWDMRFVRDFMLIFGPISSLYDFLTFFVLRRVFGAGEELFHTGWFVESLATQTLVIFVIRTSMNPLRSRPSVLLAATVIAVVAFGAWLPWSPLAGPIGFVSPPLGFVLFVAVAVVTYLGLVQLVKRAFYRLHPLA